MSAQVVTLTPPPRVHSLLARGTGSGALVLTMPAPGQADGLAAWLELAPGSGDARLLVRDAHGGRHLLQPGAERMSLSMHRMVAAADSAAMRFQITQADRSPAAPSHGAPPTTVRLVIVRTDY